MYSFRSQQHPTAPRPPFAEISLLTDLLSRANDDPTPKTLTLLDKPAPALACPDGAETRYDRTCKENNKFKSGCHGSKTIMDMQRRALW